MGGDTGGGGGSTYFSRNGASSQSSSNALDDSFRSILGSKLTNRPVDNTGFEYLTSQMVAPTDYETNTQSLYENRLSRGLALAKSGPQAVMAPLARGIGQATSEVTEEMARGRGDEVRKQQVIDRQLGVQSAQAFNTEQQGAQSVDTNTLISLANVMFPRNQAVNENYTGYGNQSSSAYNYGGQLCCFIFLEAYKGKLPWYVRAYRDKHAPESTARRVGYVEMSKWLVPAMRVSKIARFLVWHTMVNPLTKYGAACYGVNGSSKYKYLAPVKMAWFRVWTLIGKLNGAR